MSIASNEAFIDEHYNRLINLIDNSNINPQLKVMSVKMKIIEKNNVRQNFILKTLHGKKMKMLNFLQYKFFLK